MAQDTTANSERQFILAFDAGGTMTDAILVKPDGSFTVGKSISRREDEPRSYRESVTDAANNLGLTAEDDPVKVEHELCALVPPAEWGRFSLRLILHGRRVCDARKPQCSRCELAWMCPSVVPESPKESAPRV